MSSPGPGPRPVVLLFPGQGAQYRRMAVGLYGYEPVFTAAMDTAFAAAPQGSRLRSAWLAAGADRSIDDTRLAQPLLFAIDHALGLALIRRGITPAGLLGHSVGEMAAAALAGVCSAEDAIAVMVDRSARLAETPAGGMLAVASSAERVLPLLPAGATIGAVNAAWQCMVAGDEASLRAAGEELSRHQITHRRVAARNAFHSPVIAQAALESEPALARLPLRPPALTLYSAYTAAVLRPEEATSPRFWAQQPSRPVLFGPALDGLLANDGVLLVECGPGQSLATVARRHPAVRAGRSAVVPLSPARPGPPADDRRAFDSALIQLGAEGYRPHPPPASDRGT